MAAAAMRSDAMPCGPGAAAAAALIAQSVGGEADKKTRRFPVVNIPSRKSLDALPSKNNLLRKILGIFGVMRHEHSVHVFEAKTPLLMTKPAMCIHNKRNHIIHTITSSSLAVCDAETGKCVGTLAVPGISVIRDCSFSDMHGLVAVAADRTVQTIDPRAPPGRSSHAARVLSDSIGGAECAVAALECSPDGRYIACGRSDSTLGIMSLYLMGDGRNCFGHTASINSLHFQGDSNFIWTASTDKSARSFRVSSGGANKTLQSHSRGISCVRSSCDGLLVITGGLDCAAVLTWTQQSANQAPLHIMAHDAALSCVAFTPGDSQIVTCSDDGGVMLWRVDDLIKLPRIKQFDVQNQMFEDEYSEYQSSLNSHKDICRSCAAFASSTKDLLQWESRSLQKSGRVPSFTVSANAHDSVSPALAAPDSVEIKKKSCGIQRLQFFDSKSNLACAIGRPGVALLRVGEALADH